MLRRVLSTKISNTNVAAGVLSALMVVSGLLGLVRERLLAGNIGPGVITDAYIAAFKIPDILYTLAAALVSVSILLPFLNDKNEEQQQNILSQLLTVFVGAVGIVSAILIVIMPLLSDLLFPGFSPQTTEMVITQSRIMLLSPLLLGISNIFNTVSQLNHRYLSVALSPVLYNIGIIIGIAVLYPIFGTNGLAIGVVIGALLHMASHFPSFMSSANALKITTNIDWKNIWKILKTSIPRTLSLGANQLTVIGLVSIASLLVSGSVSLFNFAITLELAPVAIIGSSLAVASFASLVKFSQKAQYSNFFKKLSENFRILVLMCVPLTGILIVLRTHIVRFVFGGDAFTWNDTKITSALFGVMVLSLAAQATTQLGIRAYYALGHTWKPLRTNIITALITLVPSIAIVLYGAELKIVQDILGFIARDMGVVGRELIVLAIMFTIGDFVNMALIWTEIGIIAKRKGQSIPVIGVLLQSLGAVVIAVLVTYLVLSLWTPAFTLKGTAQVLGTSTLSALSGAVAVLVYYGLLNVPELEIIKNRLLKRGITNKTIMADE